MRNITYFIVLLFVSCTNQSNGTLSKSQFKNDNTQVDATSANGIITYDDRDVNANALLDRNGNIWFTTSREGVYRFDGNTFTNFSENEGFCSNSAWSVLEDKDGVLWFGTAKGLCRFDPSTAIEGREVFTNIPLPKIEISGPWLKKVYPLVNPNMALSMIQDQTGLFWIGTNGGGVYRFDPTKRNSGEEAFTSFLSQHGRKQMDSLHHNVVLSITEGNDGYIWFTSMTHGGISRYNPKSDQNGENGFTHFTLEDGLLDDMVFTSHKGKDGAMWFGNLDRGISRFNATDNSFTNFTETDGLCNNNVSCFYEDRKGRLWLGSFREGICIYDPLKEQFTHFLQEEENIGELRFIIEDAEENIWFGGRYGTIWRYDISDDQGEKGVSNKESNESRLTDFTQKGKANTR